MTRPSCDHTRRPSMPSRRHSFFAAIAPSWNFCDDTLLQPVFPDERTGPLPRHVDMNVDAATHNVFECDARRSVLPRLESGAQPVGEIAEPVMHVSPGGCLADLDGDHARRSMRAGLEDDAVDLAYLAA